MVPAMCGEVSPRPVRGYAEVVPKIHGSTLGEHRVLVRRSVVDALAQMLTERPFAAITMAELAERAGIGRTAIYNHFADPQAVVVALADDTTARYLSELKTAIGAADTASDQLTVYIRHHRDKAAAFHEAILPVMGQLASSSVGLKEHVHQVQGVLRDLVVGGLADGDFRPCNVDAAVSLVHACLSATSASTDDVVDFVLAALRAS